MGSSLADFILEHAFAAIVSIDAHGVVTGWNPSAEATFGRSRQEAVGQPVAELIVPESLRAAHRAGLARFLATGHGRILDRRLELSALRADGSEFPIEITIAARSEQEGAWSFHAFVRDISERVAADRERERLVEELHQALRGSERRFEAIVGSLADAVTIRDREHRIVYANPAALEMLGFSSAEELLGTPPEAIMSEFVVSDEAGREVRMEDIPSVRILRGEEAEPLLIRTLHRASGAERWNLLKAAPLVDETGEVEATITIIEDITERKRSELRATFLVEANAILASSLDYEETLRNVAQLAVPEVADWCAVDLFDEDGDRHPVAVAHVDPGRLAMAEELRRFQPERPDPERGVHRVYRTGETLVYPDIPDALLVETAVDARHLELLRAVGLRSALVAPMRLGERILGALTLVTADSGRVLHESDVQLVEQVAARAAVAIENASLYSRRSSIARTLQQSLLPEELPEIPGYELASVYLPAMEGSLVGGDFYDVWSVGESWLLMVGDVTGKGVEAAALTALVRHTMRTASEFLPDPAALLAHVDRTLKHRPSLSVCTALCLRLEGTRATLAVGGHPLPLYLEGGTVTTVGEHGPLLGAFAEAAWNEVTVELAPGSTLVAYTDGFTDTLDAGRERFGLARLREAVRAGADRSAPQVVATLRRALASFHAGSHADDIAALVLRRPAATSAPSRQNDELLAGARNGQAD